MAKTNSSPRSAGDRSVRAKIRRYVYNNVVKLVDLQKLFKCEQIQTYMANKAKVVYITSRRSKVGPSKDLGTNCHQCDKSIQLPNRFCSLGCKVEFIEDTDGSLMKFIKDWNFLPPLDVEAQNLTSNGDNASTSNNENGSEVAIMVPEGTVTGGVAGSGTTTRRRHRRKGIPHRSPFF
ncbi:hypothetical protein QJS10_CPB19g00493 [Acorus calamus]|uniref:PLATZ transcription factor family protein n=1 Tax=Acorus calamus TaxID=4465 RepID=A0AAV9CGY9_ACOCL|nr:hypothetical protein QJS10_CPB19g00493 [Acorus calamus]